MRFTATFIGGALSLLPLSIAAATLPDAGQSQQSIDQQPLQLPGKQRLELNLPDAPSTEATTGGPSLHVQGFTMQGNGAIASQDLLPLLVDLQGRTVSLGELQTGVNRITRVYREQGYPLARAYIPAQEIDGGIVQIAVMEGHYGEVSLSNTSRVADSALTPLAALQPGEAVRSASLERSLLLLSDIPGVDVKSTLTPGATVGTTNLQVDVTPGPLLSGSVDADNYGNRFTGEYRLGGTLNVNSPLGLGDRLSMRLMGSNKDQHYGRIAYQLPVGPWDTQAGVAYSNMDYELAKDFSELDAHGNARITSLYLNQPLVRSRDFSLYAQLQFDHKRLRDDIDLFDSKSKKHSNVVSATLSGNSRDTLFGGGVNSFALTWSQGHLDINGAQNQRIDALTAKTQGHFIKVNPSLVRLQRLTDRFSLYTQLQGQWTDGNLDSSEKMSLGGAYGVRAYPQGEASGDQGWLGNIEVRYALTESWQLNAFVDHGEVRLNKNTWSNGENHRSLSGAGVGTRWAAHGWQINAVAAWKLGNAEPQSDRDRSPRIWAQVVKFF